MDQIWRITTLAELEDAFKNKGCKGEVCVGTAMVNLYGDPRFQMKVTTDSFLLDIFKKRGIKSYSWMHTVLGGG